MIPDWLAGAPRPQRPAGWRPAKVYTVSMSGKSYCHALAEKPWAITTHYVETQPGTQRTVVCQGKACVCGGAAAINRRWVGFLPVVDSSLNNPGIMQISRKADEKLDVIRLQHGSIKAVRLAFYRVPRKGHKARRNDEVTVEMDGPGVADHLLPATFDVRPTVLLMFGFSAAEIDAMLGIAFDRG